MSLKQSDKNTNGNGASADAGGDSAKLRDNAEVNAKIAAYIHASGDYPAAIVSTTVEALAVRSSKPVRPF